MIWYWVDGVLVMHPQAAPSGPRGGVSEPGEDVGQYTSIVVGDDGNVHIAYQSVDHRQLKYALGVSDLEGLISWSVITLDAGGEVGGDPSERSDEEGLQTDITLDQLNRPVIIYRAVESVEGESAHPKSSTRLIRAASPLPRNSSDWGQTQVLRELTPQIP